MVPILVDLAIYLASAITWLDHRFGFSCCQQSSPSCAPLPNARIRSHRLDYSSLSLDVAVQVFDASSARHLDGSLPPPPVINVVASRNSSSRSRSSLRHASIRESAPTSCTFPIHSVSNKRDTLHHDLTPSLSAAISATSRLSRNAHSVFNVALTNSAISVTLPQCHLLQQAKREREMAKLNIRVLPGALSAHFRRHEMQSIALWQPPRTRLTRSRSHRSRFINTLPPLKSFCSHVHMACHSSPLRMVLEAPAHMREAVGPKANTSLIIRDSGASILITPHLSNFGGPITSPGTITKLRHGQRSPKSKAKAKLFGLSTINLATCDSSKSPRPMFSTLTSASSQCQVCSRLPPTKRSPLNPSSDPQRRPKLRLSRTRHGKHQ